MRLILEDENGKARIWQVEDQMANEIAGIATGMYGEAKDGDVIVDVINN